MPSYTARMEYVKEAQKRYHKASKAEKTQMLEEFCRINQYNRKYAIRLLNGPPPNQTRLSRRRPFRYRPRVIEVARDVWKASGFLCATRLKETIRDWLPFIRERFALTDDIERQLLAISPRQLDHRLRPHKRLFKRRFYSTTRPGSLLKRMIPIRTTHSDIHSPGFLEIDLVAHCGSSLSGTFLYTLTATDVQTGWTERRAVMGRGQTGVLEAIKEIHRALPFRLRALDSDNGEEFINHHLLRYCLNARPRIDFTRSRPYKKDDNAYAEQKNFTHVRRIFGWDRYDCPEAQLAMNDLYLNELRIFQNLFQPSAKLIRRTRVGTRLLRSHDRPQTPFARLAASKKGHPAHIQQLNALRLVTDPFELSQRIDRKLDAIFALISERSRSAPPSPPPSNSAPKDFLAAVFTKKDQQIHFARAAAIRRSW